MSLLIMGSIGIIALVLFLVWLLKRIIGNKKVLALVNFVIFTSAVAFEIVFIRVILRRASELSDDYYKYHPNPVAASFFWGTRRYEPTAEEIVKQKEAQKRIKELDRLRIEGRISEEVFDKAINGLIEEK